MQVLIVDDDDNKRRQLCRAVNEVIAAAQITEGRSYQSALRALVAHPFELIVLDMSMPPFDATVDDFGARSHAFAGRELLGQMDARGIHTPTIVVTQFEQFGGDDGPTLSELNAQLSSQYPDIYAGFVFFDITAARWRRDLAALITRVLRGKR